MVADDGSVSDDGFSIVGAWLAYATPRDTRPHPPSLLKRNLKPKGESQASIPETILGEISLRLMPGPPHPRADNRPLGGSAPLDRFKTTFNS